jgi:hypothetical protein
MTTVVLRQEKSLHAAFQQRREQMAVGISSLYHGERAWTLVKRRS